MIFHSTTDQNLPSDILYSPGTFHTLKSIKLHSDNLIRRFKGYKLSKKKIMVQYFLFNDQLVQNIMRTYFFHHNLP